MAHAKTLAAGTPRAECAPDYFVHAQAPLRPANAVAAILVLEDGRYLMQLRDARPDIFYPNHWGCFGGAVDPGEDPLAALRRELAEEIELEPGEAREFTRFDFDFRNLGHPRAYRIYYEVTVSTAMAARCVLHEGADMRAFGAAELLGTHQVTPYDAFAIWMHASRRRFAPERD